MLRIQGWHIDPKTIKQTTRLNFTPIGLKGVENKDIKDIKVKGVWAIRTC